MNRPLSVPLLPPPGQDRFRTDLLRAITTFFFDVVTQLNSQVQGLGGDIASSDTIYVTSAIHHVNGSAAITRIEAPTGFTGPVWLIADGEWTLQPGGNIASTAAPKQNSVLQVVYDGIRWYAAG
jgi:hypothetical protein